MNFNELKIYKALKRNQVLYFTKIRLLNEDYKSNLKLIGSSFKSEERIKSEMAILQTYWHCNPLHYIRYGLYNKDLTIEELKDYIPPYFHYNYYNENLYKGVNTALFGNKLFLYNIFKKKGIPTPEVIAIVKDGKLYDLNYHQLSNSCLSNENKLFFKPVDGAGGTGICVFNGIGIDKFLSNLDRKKVYIVQRGIVQREDINEINSSSVNTLRVITQMRLGKPIICVCVMRIGRNGNFVDNSHQGGLSIQIDVTNGTFYPYATSEHGGGKIEFHPDSGFKFKDKKIGYWSNICNKILECASLFPELKEIAWDVALTRNGIEMIELNLGYGIDHLQCTCGGLRRVLNIFPK